MFWLFQLLCIPLLHNGLGRISLGHFIFIFRVTVTAGTTSGLIFYANVILVNRNLFYPSTETNVLTVFIAWLNLDLGIETCLFHGMDAYIRTWLQFVFPLYIWLLVGLITLASRYSMTVARIIGPTNPISVLATLFLLSYTKLLRTTIATLAFTTLEYPNGKSFLCGCMMETLHTWKKGIFHYSLLACYLSYSSFFLTLFSCSLDSVSWLLQTANCYHGQTNP